ncbi:MAG TPA: DUF993 family protein, partial [Methylomirabilota bacterium]|nr:DUF993 family protein [Methylomirabilota bacterium]
MLDSPTTKTTLRLPTLSGGVQEYRLGAASPYPSMVKGPFNRVAFAAAHVVANPLALYDPWVDTAIDWDATMAFRRHLWSLGFSIAEAM